MEKFDEMIKELIDAHIMQTSIDWEENIPIDLWNKYFSEGYGKLAYHLDIDKHRWYELSTTVIGIYGRLLGIRHVSALFSESMTVADVNEGLAFYEMEEVTTITYKNK